MLDKIDGSRIIAMTAQEQRRLINLKKAFYESDLAFSQGHPENGAMEEICKAVDAAQMLRRSLLGEDCSPRENKRHFTAFIDLDVPNPENGGPLISLVDATSGKPINYSYSQMVYAIRCAVVHENENLNAAENPDYHIQLDWTMSEHAGVGGYYGEGKVILNARAHWNRIREVLSNFITGLDFLVAIETGDAGGMTIRPPLLSIRP